MQNTQNLSFQEFETFYLATNKHEKNHDKNKEEEITELPAQLSIGITMMLAGGFLCVVGAYLKMPTCITSGQALFWGVLTLLLKDA